MKKEKKRMPADYQVLKTELALAAYNNTSHQAAADLLNALNKTRDRTIVPTYLVTSAIVQSEYNALSANQKNLLALYVSANMIDVKSSHVRQAFQDMFGPGSTTRTNLQAVQFESISRAAELGWPQGVTEHDVAHARSI